MKHFHRTTSLPLYLRDNDGRPAGMLDRNCTEDYKIVPNNRVIREWLLSRGYGKVTKGNDWYEDHYSTSPAKTEYNFDNDPNCYIKVQRDVYVECWFGISSDETYRAKERGPGWQMERYPLLELDMSRDDCLDWFRERGIRPPLKSSCKTCPYHSLPAWAWMHFNAPEEFEEACQFDDWLRSPARLEHSTYGKVEFEMYLCELRTPLRDVDWSLYDPTSKDEHTLKAAAIFGSCKSTNFSCHS